MEENERYNAGDGIREDDQGDNARRRPGRRRLGHWEVAKQDRARAHDKDGPELL